MRQPEVAMRGEVAPARPWLTLYAAGMPADLDKPASSALEYFTRARLRSPDRVAVWYFDASLTFAQLDAHVDALANALRARNVGKGHRVGVLNQNTPATLVAILAAWRIGAVIVPMNPMLTAREVAAQLEDARALAVVVGADFANALPPLVPASSLQVVIVTFAHDFLDETASPDCLRTAARSLDLPAGWVSLSDVLRTPPAPLALSADLPISGEAPAFLTYTSGTTGKPKGAINTHANTAFSAEIWRRWLQLDERDVLLAAAPFSHITGLVAHIVTAFAAGVPLVLTYRFDPAAVLEAIERRGCTSTVAAITAFTALINDPTFDAARLKTFRKLYSGGAPVAAAVVSRWEEATGVYIHNAYGLTETTSPAHLTPFGSRAPVDAATGALAVGIPVCSTYCRIVDVHSGEEVPDGEVGELQIRGPQVVPGYWHKPLETAQTFIGGHWLRTGDLCRRDPEGWFYIVDRVKDVIIASGFKVWPREVEDVLMAHAAVSEAAVVGIADPYRGESPKAFVTLRPGRRVDKEELQAFCRANLAAYKVPREFEFLDSLPKTASGKILRRVLREGAAA